MKIFPAIDISGAKVVRLTQGDYDAMTVYSDTPLAAAADFRDTGAEYLHMVDLDGAKNGSLTNFDIITEAARVSGIFCQAGGGIRDMARLEKYLEAGLHRAILGSAAVEDPAFLNEAVARYGERVAVGIDSRDGFVSVHGWRTDTKLDGRLFCAQLRDIGVRTVIYTDISRDGMLEGPNHELYAELSEISDIEIIASGGVTSVDDIQQLKNSGVHGAIIGKALYTGFLTLADALAAAK